MLVHFSFKTILMKPAKDSFNQSLFYMTNLFSKISKISKSLRYIIFYIYIVFLHARDNKTYVLFSHSKKFKEQ